VTESDPSAIPYAVHDMAPGASRPAAGETEPADAELVAAAQRDRRAFDALYRRYLARVYRYARARVGTDQDAEDVTTATFIETLNGLAGYDEQGRFGAWLFTIAHRQVLAHRRRTPATDELEALRLAAPGAPPGDERDILARALGRLSEDRREAILLRFYGDLKVAEIAEVMGKGESAVKMLLHRGLAQLRDLLREDPRGG
jgi:RNA polymerase sigma-70 factor (ECF subfamily)